MSKFGSCWLLCQIYQIKPGKLPNQNYTNNACQNKPSKPELWIDDWVETLKKHKNSTPFDNVCCYKCSWSLGWLVCVSWHWPGLPLGYSVRKIISHIRGRPICQSVIFSRYCQGVLVPGTVCQVTGNYLIFPAYSCVLLYFQAQDKRQLIKMRRFLLL